MRKAHPWRTWTATLRTETKRTAGRKLQRMRLDTWAKTPLCAGCQRLTHYPHGFQLDHIKPLHKGGDDHPDNLQILCHQCHEAKTAKDMGIRVKVEIGIDGWPK